MPFICRCLLSHSSIMISFKKNGRHIKEEKLSTSETFVNFTAGSFLNYWGGKVKGRRCYRLQAPWVPSLHCSLRLYVLRVDILFRDNNKVVTCHFIFGMYNKKLLFLLSFISLSCHIFPLSNTHRNVRVELSKKRPSRKFMPNSFHTGVSINFLSFVCDKVESWW